MARPPRARPHRPLTATTMRNRPPHRESAAALGRRGESDDDGENPLPPALEPTKDGAAWSGRSQQRRSGPRGRQHTVVAIPALPALAFDRRKR